MTGTRTQNFFNSRKRHYHSARRSAILKIDFKKFGNVLDDFSDSDSDGHLMINKIKFKCKKFQISTKNILDLRGLPFSLRKIYETFIYKMSNNLFKRKLIKYNFYESNEKKNYFSFRVRNKIYVPKLF